MICEEVLDSLSPFIQKEIDGEERIQIFEHLQICNDCRDAYLGQLKIYYSLERGKVLISPPAIKHGFKQKIIDAIDDKNNNAMQFQKKWIWYAAAAILICGILVGRYTLPLFEKQSIISHTKSSDSFTHLIESENWSALQSILEDQDEFSKYAKESLNIQVLLEKLSKLHHFGQNIPTISISSAPDTHSQRVSAKIEISIEDFILLLEQIKIKQEEITLAEVSEILVDI